MHIGSAHVEQINFFEFTSPNQPVILGYPWLKLQNLQIDWQSGKITFSSSTCCSCSPTDRIPTTIIGPIQIESDIPFFFFLSDIPNLSSVPICYHDLR